MSWRQRGKIFYKFLDIIYTILTVDIHRNQKQIDVMKRATIQEHDETFILDSRGLFLGNINVQHECTRLFLLPDMCESCLKQIQNGFYIFQCLCCGW